MTTKAADERKYTKKVLAAVALVAAGLKKQYVAAGALTQSEIDSFELMERLLASEKFATMTLWALRKEIDDDSFSVSAAIENIQDLTEFDDNNDVM
jgi:hypothetical protein